MWSSVRHQPGPQFNGALLTPRRAALSVLTAEGAAGRALVKAAERAP